MALSAPLLVKLFPFYALLTILIGYYFGTSMVRAYTMRMQVTAAQDELQSAHVTDIAVVFGIPTEIIVPAAAIAVPIKPGIYNIERNEWEISDTAAHFATITAPANNSQGNTVVYAHNSDKLFGRLAKLTKGDKVFVKTSFGRTFEYGFTSISQVVPTDTSVFFQHSQKPTLTLITCSGTWNEKRSLLVFDLVRVYE